MEKPGGLTCCQTPAPNLHGRCNHRATTQTPSPGLDTEGLTPKLLSSTTTTQTPTPRLDAEGLTPILLRLKLLHLILGIFFILSLSL
jgi:hypothetical protein